MDMDKHARIKARGEQVGAVIGVLVVIAFIVMIIGGDPLLHALGF